MNDMTEKMLDDLWVDSKAKDILRGMDRVLNAKSSRVRESASALVVSAGEGCGVSSYGRVLASIVNSSLSKKIKGSFTFLELVFPKDNEKDEMLFYASPRRMASIRNRYYGTMLISLKEYAGTDLIKSESFARLLKFICENKNTVQFMVHILPDFAAKNQLLSKLREVINVTEVSLQSPDLENSYMYIVTGLKKEGCELDEDALKTLKNEILPNLIIEKTYTGYNSLNSLLSRLILEMTMSSENDEMLLNGNVIGDFMDRYKREAELSKKEMTGIGFRM